MKNLFLITIFSLLILYAEDDVYIHASLGTSQIDHTTSNKNLLASTQNDIIFGNSFDMGIYVPLNENCMIGYSMSYISDNYPNDVLPNIHYYLDSISALYFLADEYSSFFVRTDIGSSYLAYSNQSGIASRGETKQLVLALGGIIGIGYKIDSFVMALNAHSFNINGERASSLNIFVGILW